MIKRLVSATVLIFLLFGLGAVSAADWIYTARPGDNLWNLSEEYLERGIAYTGRLQQHNQIDDPLRIAPGTAIRFPVVWLKVQPASATLLDVLGQASLLMAGSSLPTPLQIGAILRIGDRLETGAGASATIEFADGSRLIVYENTQVSMDSLSAYGRTGMVDTRLRLQGGRVETAVEPSEGPASRFEIITPAAIAAVRGTDFRIGASDDSAAVMLTEVVAGDVAVEGAGEVQDIPAGFGTVTKQGIAPEPARPLLAAPDVGALPSVAERTLLEFEWPAIEGATAYRAQLFASMRFERLLLDKVVTRPRVEWNAPADDSYVLRLRGIDAVNLEGLDAVHEFVLNARPEPPAPLGPADGAAMHGVAPELWWSTPGDIVSFSLEVSRDADFLNRLLVVDELTESRFTFEAEPPPGSYFWRLASRHANGETGPFGEPQRFRVQAVPEPVEADEPALDEHELRFSWGRTADTVAYEFELAKSEDFSELFVHETVDDTAYVMDIPPGGTYYFRARGLSDEGVAGPYSPVNRIEVPSDKNFWPLIVLLPLLLLL